MMKKMMMMMSVWNYTERRAQTPTLCTFYNSDFLIYSSMGSFYIPCFVDEILRRTVSASRSRFSSILLHPVRCDGPALLAHLPYDTPANTQVGRRRRCSVVGFGTATPEVDVDVSNWRQQTGHDDGRP